MNGQLHFNEPMSKHTTFKTGGPADIYCAPADVEELKNILKEVNLTNTPKYIIGGGANLLVSDHGLRGIVIDTCELNAVRLTEDGDLQCGAGLVMDKAADAALDGGFSGFDSFFGMPGTVGGAVWMNARCYGVSISDLIISVEYIIPGEEKTRILKSTEMKFDYKKSIFQEKDWIILEAGFKLLPGNKNEIRRTMDKNRADRENKGHYAGPSAGSIFKNNRSFGKPSGAIIDSLSLRGSSAGGAIISKEHANIFMNTGSATSADILNLIRRTQKKVMEAYGFELEPEIQLIGDFTHLT